MIQFPCFLNEILYVYIKDHDSFEDDTSATIALACGSLFQESEIQVPLREKSTFLETIYDVVEGSAVAEFKFFDETLKDESIYSMKLKVSETCKESPLVDESLQIDGRLQVRSVEREVLDQKVAEEDFTNKPTLPPIPTLGRSQLR